MKRPSSRLEAGRLRHRVEIQRAHDVQDAFGEPVKAWNTVATVWAAVEPMTGDERFRSDQETAERPVRILMRHRADVTVKHRIKFGSRLFDVQSVTDPGFQAAMLELICEETHP